jgi:hypothetical protein
MVYLVFYCFFYSFLAFSTDVVYLDLSLITDLSFILLKDLEWLAFELLMLLLWSSCTFMFDLVLELRMYSRLLFDFPYLLLIYLEEIKFFFWVIGSYLKLPWTPYPSPIIALYLFNSLFLLYVYLFYVLMFLVHSKLSSSSLRIWYLASLVVGHPMEIY